MELLTGAEYTNLDIDWKFHLQAKREAGQIPSSNCLLQDPTDLLSDSSEVTPGMSLAS